METEQKIIDNEILLSIQEQLNEEKWTRATIENYSKKNFIEMDEIIKKAMEQSVDEQLYNLCCEHLAHSPQSIIALYIIGMISLQKDAFDLSALYKVINKFREFKKFTVVEYLSDTILERGDDKFVLNTLKEIYETTGNNDELYKIWERLVKIDYNNGEIARKLADLRLEEKNINEAIYYYKTALKRYAKQRTISAATEIWEILMKYIPLDLEFYYLIEKEIAKPNTEETDKEAATLLKMNVEYAIKEGKIDDAIELLIKILRYDQKDKDMRNKLADCLKIKYEKHSQLNECLKSSSINQTWKNFDLALDEFQRRIAFDIGNYVYHRSWGIGQIVELNETHMIIDFEKKKEHKMSLNMALTSLKVIPPDHIWIQKKEHLEQLQDETPEGIERTLKLVLKSLNDEASRKEIKDELVPSIISAKDWTKWWTKAKNVIKKSEIIGQIPGKEDTYNLRENPLTLEEEALKNFQSVATFDDKFNILINYINIMKESKNDENIETLTEMFEYFTEICNKSEVIDDKVIKSFLLLKKIKKENSRISVDIQLNPNTFTELDQETIESIFNKIEDVDFKRLFLKQIKKVRSDWAEVFETIIIDTNITKAYDIIFDELLSSEKQEVIKRIVDEFFSNQRKNLEAYLWCIKTIFKNDNLRDIIKIDEESILTNLLRLLDVINRDIENKKNVTHNKKLHSQIIELVTKEERIENIIDNMKNEERLEDCQRLAALLRGTISLKEKIKSKILSTIYEKFPELEQEYEERREIADSSLIVTKEAYDRKQKEYQNIVNIEIPQNSRDIGNAQEKGDLRENAEYQIALDRQKQLQAAATKLELELRKAKILDFGTVDISKISIGTKVTLLNMQTKKKEIYSILGEWDSDIEQNIISYLSPLGSALIGGLPAETVTFTHEGNKRKYKVIKIEKAEKVK